MQELLARALLFLHRQSGTLQPKKGNIIMPFIVWVALSLAILIIAGSTGKIIIDTPPVIQPLVQAGSHGASAVGYAVAAGVVIVAAILAFKYGRSNK